MGNEKPPADRGKQEKEKKWETCRLCKGSGRLKKDANTYIECTRCLGKRMAFQ